MLHVPPGPIVARPHLHCLATGAHYSAIERRAAADIVDARRHAPADWTLIAPEDDGPVYPSLPELDAHRRVANSAKETAEQAAAYGRAVGDAFRKLNRISASKPIPTACSAETDAKCRARHIAELHRACAADRRRRTDEEIVSAYHAAMKAKREREAIEASQNVRTALDAPAWTVLLAWDMGLEPANANCAEKGEAMEIRLSEAEAAKAWREAMNLSREQLAERIGFSVSQIVDYEQGARRGKKGSDAVISHAAWLRYRLACTAFANACKPAWD